MSDQLLGGVEIWVGSVATWECDVMGHLNVAFYMAKSMEGLAGMAGELGMPHAFRGDAGSTLVVREQYVRFVGEALANAPLRMTGAVLEVGETDMRLVFLLHHADGRLSAAFQTLVSHVTARDQIAFPWPDRVRERAKALSVALPDAARPRSLTLEPFESQASRARADELGLRRIALGALKPSDCDAFGRMKPEMLMSRISEGIPNLWDGKRLGGDQPGVRLGGAALEYRIAHLAWPQAGDRIEVRSGSSWTNAKVRKLTHWLLNPADGKPWGVSEAVIASFDLDARKIVVLSDAELTRAQSQVVAGLTL